VDLTPMIVAKSPIKFALKKNPSLINYFCENDTQICNYIKRYIMNICVKYD